MRLSILLALLLSGCAHYPSMDDSCQAAVMKAIGECIEEPFVERLPTYQKLFDLPAPEKQPIVAVYEFNDKTGQRKQKAIQLCFLLLYHKAQALC